jgi:hypothetical protein
MPGLEKIEVVRYRDEIVRDIDHLVKKYCRIIGWEVPDVDDQEARRLVLQALKEAVAQVEAGKK